MKLLLDSGAFSTWTKGVPIAVADYVAFVQQHGAAFDNCINLDVIPASGVDVDQAAADSYRNLQIMKGAGLHPLPVFHQGEDFTWLERMLREGDPYICLSPSQARSTKDRRGWVRECFRVIGGGPVKVHGLGLSTIEMVAGIPWASFDSSTWALQGGYGKVPVTRRDAEGLPDYALPPIVVGLTDDLPSGLHVDAMSDPQISRVRRHLEEFGTSMVEARYSPTIRSALWVQYFLRMAAAASAEIYFATSQGGGQRSALDRAGARKCLVSYAWLNSASALRRFVEGQSPKQKQCKSRRWASKSYKARRALALHDRVRRDAEAPLPREIRSGAQNMAGATDVR